MLVVHPILLRWDDAVEASVPNHLLTTDVVMVVVVFVVYPAVNGVVEAHLVQPLDVEVFLVVLCVLT